MTDWQVQLRIRVGDEHLEEAKLRMAELAAEFDARPRFLTCQAGRIRGKQ